MLYQKHENNKKNNNEWSFDQAVEFLTSTREFALRPDLDRLRQLLERLGNPQNACPVIHVAGTNGKGSISAMCAFIAASSDKKVGLFTSFYLSNYKERIRILDGKKGIKKIYSDPESAEISEDNFAKIMAVVAFEIEVMKAKGYDVPTELEMITAAAFIYFAEKKCDLLILETGLSGTLDSTNVVENKIASIITALSYAPAKRVGKSILEIVAENVGIMSKDVPTILYDPFDTELSEKDAEQATKIIQEQAEKIDSPLKIVKKADIEIVSSYVSEQSFFYQDMGPFHIQFGGDYQTHNAAIAIETSRQFLDARTIEDGLAMTKWPGRLECLSKEPSIIIDGAHNPQGVQGLKKHLEKFLVGRKLIVLFGALANKDYQKMLEIFLSSNLYHVAQVICTEPDFEGKLSADKLAEKIRIILNNQQEDIKVSTQILDGQLPKDSFSIYNNKVFYSQDRNLATQYAFDLAKANQLPLVVFGSQHLIGNIRPGLIALTEGKDL